MKCHLQHFAKSLIDLTPRYSETKEASTLHPHIAKSTRDHVQRTSGKLQRALFYISIKTKLLGYLQNKKKRRNTKSVTLSSRRKAPTSTPIPTCSDTNHSRLRPSNRDPYRTLAQHSILLSPSLHHRRTKRYLLHELRLRCGGQISRCCVDFMPVE